MDIKSKFQSLQQLSNDQRLIEYSNLSIPNSKQQFCKYYLKGICIFDKNECKYAHCINDLQFEFPEQNNTPNQGVAQYSLKLETNYKALYEYQIKLKNENKPEFQTIYTLEEIHNDQSKMKMIRQQLVNDLTHQLMDMLQAKCGNSFLTKTFVEKSFQKANLPYIKFNAQQNRVWIESKILLPPKLYDKTTVLLKIPEKDKWNNLLVDRFSDIIYEQFRILEQNQELLHNVFPLSLELVNTEYYLRSSVTEPGLHVYLKMNSLFIDQFFTNLENSESFKNSVKLKIQEFNNRSDIQNLIHLNFQDFRFFKTNQKQPDYYFEDLRDKLFLVQNNNNNNNQDSIQQQSGNISSLNQVNNTQDLVNFYKRADIKQLYCNFKKLTREQVIEAYQNIEIPTSKSVLCQFYLRGLCIFDQNICKFAHGVKDLEYNTPNFNRFQNNENEENEKKPQKNQKKQNEENDEDNEDDEGQVNEEDDIQGVQSIEKQRKRTIKVIQASLRLEKSYQILYEYQFKLIEQNKLEVSQPYTIEQINKEKKIRHTIRFAFQQDIGKEFMEFLFEKYKGTFLTKRLVDACFEQGNFPKRYFHQTMNSYCYEQKILLPPRLKHKVTVLLKYPSDSEWNQLLLDRFKDIIYDQIELIIQQNKELDEVFPLGVNKINQEYYLKSQATEPGLHVYLKNHQINIDQFLNNLEFSENFQNILKSKLTQFNRQDIQDLITLNFEGFSFFRSSLKDLDKLKQLINSTYYQYLNDTNNNLFIPYDSLEELLVSQVKSNDEYGNPYGSNFRKNVKSILSECEFQTIILHTGKYHFKKGQLLKTQQLNQKWIPNYQNCPLNQQIQQKQQNNVMIDYQNLCRYYDEIKVIIVDNEQAIQYAEYILRDKQYLGIDLEGALKPGGRLELIQISDGHQIFIFDVWQIKYVNFDEEQGIPLELAIPLYDNMRTVLKDLLEDPNKIKVFHDGRKDSLALHYLLGICPKICLDTAAVYLLIETLKMYVEYGDKINKPKEIMRLINQIEQIKFPGINDVLTEYQASHGLNELKEEMHAKFNNISNMMYFLQRPIPEDFLRYAAKDVEDLIEVTLKMLTKTKLLLQQYLTHDVTDPFTLNLMLEASQNLSKYGCRKLISNSQNTEIDQS